MHTLTTYSIAQLAVGCLAHQEPAKSQERVKFLLHIFNKGNKQSKTACISMTAHYGLGLSTHRHQGILQ